MSWCSNKGIVLKLIRLYKENECLWNTKSVFYRKKSARDNAYKRIFHGMNDNTMTIDELKCRIKTLLMIYKNEYERVRSMKTLGVINEAKLFWYSEMNFLTNHIEERDSSEAEERAPSSARVANNNSNDAQESVVGDGDNCSEIFIKKEFEEVDVANMEEYGLEKEQTDATTTMEDILLNGEGYVETMIDEPPAKKPKSKHHSNKTSDSNNHSEFLYNLYSNIGGDEFFYFGMSVASQLKNMPLEKAITLQAKIQNLLTQERCEDLRNTTTNDHNYTQRRHASTLDTAWIDAADDNKNESSSSTVYKEMEIDDEICIPLPSTSNVTYNFPKKPLIESKFRNNQVMSTLNTIIENQTKLQEQLMARESPNLQKIIQKNLAISKESFKTTKKILGEGLSTLEDQMSSFFPLSTFDEIDELEDKIKCKLNESAMRTYLASTKKHHNLDSQFRTLITDDILDAFNWDGRAGKKALKGLKLFDVILSEIHCHLTRKEYESEVRKFIELSHNRAKQKRIKQQISRVMIE